MATFFRSTGIVVIFYALSKVTGFIKLRYMTAAFGVSAEADALTAAIQLPELFMMAVAGGALATALIPVYSDILLHADEAERERLSRQVFSLILVTMGGLCLISAIFAPWIARVVMVPHFSAKAQQLTASLMRIIMIGMTLVAFSSAIGALLNAHHHYALPALATVVIDVGWIIGLVYFVPRFGIHGAAWGAVLGSLMHFLVQAPAVWRYRIRWRPYVIIPLRQWLREPNLQRTLQLMGPRVITIALTQMADLFVIRSASALPEGSVSIYFYALLVAGIPTSLFAWAVGNVVLPHLADDFNLGKTARFRQTAQLALWALWVLLIPAAVGLVVLGRPAIAYLFERGEFDANATTLLYNLMVILAIRIIAEGALVVLERISFARHDTRTVMWGYCVWFIVYVGGVSNLRDTIGVYSLPAASSLSIVTLTIFLFVRSRQRFGAMFERSIGQRLGRIIMATGLMSVCVLLLRQLTLPLPQYVWGAIITAGAVYVATYAILDRTQLSQLWRTLRENP